MRAGSSSLVPAFIAERTSGRQLDSLTMAGRPQAQSEWNGHGRSAVYQSDDQQHGDIIILQLGQGWRLIISLFPSLGSGGGGGGQRDTSAETANLSMLKALPVAARAVASCAALCICIRPSRLDGVGVGRRRDAREPDNCTLTRVFRCRPARLSAPVSASAAAAVSRPGSRPPAG